MPGRLRDRPGQCTVRIVSTSRPIGELYLRMDFIVTNLSRPAERIAFYKAAWFSAEGRATLALARDGVIAAELCLGDVLVRKKSRLTGRESGEFLQICFVDCSIYWSMDRSQF